MFHLGFKGFLISGIIYMVNKIYLSEIRFIQVKRVVSTRILNNFLDNNNLPDT